MTSERITDRNQALSPETAGELLAEAGIYLRCPERDYQERGTKILEALEALNWPACRECRDELAVFVMDEVPLCIHCHACEMASAWAGVLQEVSHELSPAGRGRLVSFLEAVNKREADLDFALDFSFSDVEVYPAAG
jgi:hypothetical protein